MDHSITKTCYSFQSPKLAGTTEYTAKGQRFDSYTDLREWNLPKSASVASAIVMIAHQFLVRSFRGLQLSFQFLLIEADNAA